MASDLLQWKEDQATGPDGTRYQIQSDHIHGESREYWAEFKAPGELSWSPVPVHGRSTDRRRAKREAEKHARQRVEEPHTDE